MDGVSSNKLSPCSEILKHCKIGVKPGKLLLDGQNRLTYGVLVDRIARIGNMLRQEEMGCGQRAILISDDDAAVIEIFFGLISCGVAVVLLNPHGTKSEFESLIEAADASMAFVDDGRFDDVSFDKVLRPGSPIIRIRPNASSGKGLLSRLIGAAGSEAPASRDTYPDLLTQYADEIEHADDIPASTTAYILFTSGTTSRPKGVEISHGNLFAQMSTFVRQYDLDNKTRILNLLPFHHTDGLTHGAVLSLVAGGTLVRPMRFRIDRLLALLDEIYKSRITHFITVPPMLSLICQVGSEYSDCFDTEDFRFIISTAAYLDPGLWEDLQRTHNVQIVNVYGLTETVCEACYCGPDVDSFRLGTVGKPVDCEARIVDEQGDALPPGEAGELLIKGDNVMKGYLNMPEETAEVLKNGWFHTGDIATIDEDGFVRIVGRKKSVIISAGNNIYPEDVTNVLMQMDGIVDAVTLGMPDPIWGETVVACIIADDTHEIMASDVSQFFLKHAAREKLPREFHFMSEFPRGPAGKVILNELRSRIDTASKESNDNDSYNDASIESVVTLIAARTFKVPSEQLGMEASPETVASWNSLAHFEFLMALEVEFGERFTPRDIMSIANLGQAIIVLEAKLG